MTVRIWLYILLNCPILKKTSWFQTFDPAADYSGGGYSGQYSVPPPAMTSNDNNYGSGQGYNQSSYAQNQGQDWNQPSSGKMHFKSIFS